MTDNHVLGALASMVPGGAHVGAENGATKPVQIGLTVCKVCDRAWQQGAGAMVPIAPEALEQARCDARHIGDIHAEHPERAHTDIPPATRRLVDNGVRSRWPKTWPRSRRSRARTPSF